MIRKLHIMELGTASKLGFEFFKDAALPGRFVPEIWIKNWSEFLRRDMGEILGHFDDAGTLTGCIGYMISHDINDGAKIAGEAFWFVHPECRGGGVKLLLYFLQRAKELGCTRILMMHLYNQHAERLSKFYQKLGFKPVETHYHKSL